MLHCWEFKKCANGPSADVGGRKACVATLFPKGSCYLVAGSGAGDDDAKCTEVKRGGRCENCAYYAKVTAGDTCLPADFWAKSMQKWLDHAQA